MLSIASSDDWVGGGLSTSLPANPSKIIVLTGKLKAACRIALGIVRNMFDKNTIENLPVAA